MALILTIMIVILLMVSAVSESVFLIIMLSTGIGSMHGYTHEISEWNTHKVTLFSELFFIIDLVYTWESEHPFTKSSSYAYDDYIRVGKLCL